MHLRCAHHTRPAKLLALAILVICFGPLDAAAQAPRYTVTDLGPFEPAAVNDVGQVVGFAIIDGRGHAVLYDGSFKTIDPPGTVSPRATGINNRGQIVGTTGICDFVDGNCVNSRARAFIFHRGAFTILGTLGGRASFGFDLDEAGRAIGFSSTAGPVPNTDGEEQAFASAPGGGPLENLGAKMGVEGSDAFGVSPAGLITGLFGGRSERGMFLYDGRDGTFSLIRTPPFSSTGVSSAVNDLGQIVGHYGSNDDGRSRAFLYSGGTLTDLGHLLPSHTNSRAWAINNFGQIVGVSSPSWFHRSGERAFLYEGGTMLDLNSLIPAGSGWVLNEATDINAHGQIVGRGTLNGEERAFTLTPTEPVLLTEPDSAKAIALDSVTFVRDPFPLSTAHNFSTDGRTRVTLIARNVEFAPNEGVQDLAVRAEGAEGVMHSMPVEHVGRVPGFPSLRQITVRLPDSMAAGGDFRLFVTLRGASSNVGTVSIRAMPTANIL
jgi:probable HAF family extracellular repeat protein